MTYKKKGKPKRSKYGAKGFILFDNEKFASFAELKRYKELKTLLNLGLISDLTLHPKFDLIVHGTKLGIYTADFKYIENGFVVVEETKSAITAKERSYRFRVKLFKVLYPDLIFREIIY